MASAQPAAGPARRVLGLSVTTACPALANRRGSLLAPMTSGDRVAAPPTAPAAPPSSQESRRTMSPTRRAGRRHTPQALGRSSMGSGGGAHIGCSPTVSTAGLAARSVSHAGALSDVTSIHSGGCLRGGNRAAYSAITAGVTLIGTEKTTTSHLAMKSLLPSSLSPASTPTTSTAGYAVSKKRMSHLPKS
eukprot:CAMPEP_0206304042 /NCGR_PEP_ID=MMETSP0106_2-20121207/9544_1 /ASSEMBLY_ACC=CAM_ASM_000206 /TAXON_ID=81532 /ORGANISM="Acanthoeca-like sp., Strain 10tr" /LENGTH=189 /DNA_ID=CAMNT_0053734847 /DNA_START=680 /DNA_END=1245 /DNA_ORIENTATION=+